MTKHDRSLKNSEGDRSFLQQIKKNTHKDIWVLCESSITHMAQAHLRKVNFAITSVDFVMSKPS